MPAGVATTTLTTFLSTTFSTGLDMVLYILGVAWPYLMVVGIVAFFWFLGKRIFYIR